MALRQPPHFEPVAVLALRIGAVSVVLWKAPHSDPSPQADERANWPL